jgi:hypothetical protein
MLANIIIVQDEIILSIIIYNVISRYYPIRTIDIPIIQLLSLEVILELEQETTNNIFNVVYQRAGHITERATFPYFPTSLLRHVFSLTLMMQI